MQGPRWHPSPPASLRDPPQIQNIKGVAHLLGFTAAQNPESMFNVLKINDEVDCVTLFDRWHSLF